MILSSDSSITNRLFMTCNPIDSTLLTVLLLQPDDYGSINKASHWLFMPQLVKQLCAGRNLKINT